MALKIKLYDRTGRLFDEIPGEADCFWRLNEMGQADLSFPITEPKLREEVIRYGNLVKIEHLSASDWGGVVRVPEAWSESELSLRAISPEILLNDRVVGQKVTLTGSSGDIFAGIIQLANSQEDTRLRIDAIYRGGSPMSFDVQFETLWQALKRLRQYTGGEWSMEPAEDGSNALYFKCSWYQARGIRQPIVLESGHNIATGGQIISVKREIVNQVTAVQQAATEAERPFAVWEAAASKSRYGLRQSILNVWSPEGVEANLVAAATSEVNRLKNPQRLYKLDAVERQQGDTFPYLGLGDTLRLRIIHQRFGVDTTVRVLAKEYDDRAGYMPLAVQEVI